jgi:uncharacterized spore protein YtfJ
MTQSAAPEMQSMISEGLERTAGTVSASEVFGPAHEVGGRIVITAAAVERGGGFGFGSGGDAEGNGGGGGGGGGGVNGRPVAVIEAGPTGIEVHPIIDFTRLGIALLGTFLALWRATRRHA